MTIVELNGGLGNQIMQYIFSRHQEIIYKKEVIHDFMQFFVTLEHNGYELDTIFKNIKTNLIVNNLEPDVWKDILKMYTSSPMTHSLPSIFLESGVDIVLIADGYWYDPDPNIRFQRGFEFNGQHDFVYQDQFHDPKNPKCIEILNFENVYYKGVWFTDLYGKAIKKEIEHELQFPELQHQENIDYRDAILASDVAVGLHVRRGDFLTVDSKLKNISNEKYATKIRDVKRSLAKSNSHKPNFFIFSDDLDWCKENTNQLGFSDNDNITFIQGNDVDKRNYIDMQLMTYCDYLVHNFVSSFALAAQMISPKEIIRIPC